jgi:hypothetical protein
MVQIKLDTQNKNTFTRDLLNQILRIMPAVDRFAVARAAILDNERRRLPNFTQISLSPDDTVTSTAHRKCAVRRRHRDVASANTPLNLHTVLSLVTFFARAKKVTRSRSE